VDSRAGLEAVGLVTEVKIGSVLCIAEYAFPHSFLITTVSTSLT